MRKKILAIVFAALLAIAMAVPAFAGEHANQNGDVGDVTQVNPDNPGQETEDLDD